MSPNEQPTELYLGKHYDQALGKTTDKLLMYDPNDLTTHAVVVGMTGSGKTGLCVNILEELALSNVPALLIDPKGDITNLLLHFPDLAPQDFLPWIDPDQARREKKSMEQTATETAERWRAGLAEWGVAPERIQALKNSAHFAIYTPGSDAGIPVSILASLKAPPLAWEGEQNMRELLREKISGTVTALLGLVGLNDIDPVRSREHILLSNIFESAWREGNDLDLGELILMVQSPPFAKLGVFDVNVFFPQKDRFELAMLLNNILASPAFQTWIEGEPLDIPTLLYGKDGRPRHSVFYIAHLSDAERMFFVTLLYSAVESWMRTQTGTNSLRAVVYFDEIFGYLPPVSIPPSKPILLRLLKQGRAFGVGQVLVSQNPGDIDYKALSNTGTWFIGKLQTDQDKQRLLDGLQSAIGGAMDRGEYDRLLSSLGKRVFLMQNVHEKGPQLMQTRWAMNFLAGPMARTQIPQLNRLVGAVPPPAPPIDQLQPITVQSASVVAAAAASAAARQAGRTPSAPAAPQASDGFSATRPSTPAGTTEYFLPYNVTLHQAVQEAGHMLTAAGSAPGAASLIYRPALLAQVGIRYINHRYNLDYDDRKTVLAIGPDRRGAVRWENCLIAAINPRGLDNTPDPQGRFATLEAPFSDLRSVNAMQKDFMEWIYRTALVTVRAHEGLKVYGGPDVSQADFRRQCSEAAKRGMDAELAKTTSSYATKLTALKTKLAREQRELDMDERELGQRKMEEYGTHAENLLNLFSRRRNRLTTSLTKRRQTEQAKAEVDESVDAIDLLEKQIKAMEAERDDALQAAQARWTEMANNITELTIAPYKKDVLIEVCGIAWTPMHRVEIGGQFVELPAYKL